MILEKIDEAAKQWNKTKDPKYKNLWYTYVKEYANGFNNTQRRVVSTTSSDKRNNGRNRHNS